MIDQEIIFNYLVEQLDLGELQWIYNILKKEDNKGCSNWQKGPFFDNILM